MRGVGYSRGSCRLGRRMVDGRRRCSRGRGASEMGCSCVLIADTCRPPSQRQVLSDGKAATEEGCNTAPDSKSARAPSFLAAPGIWAAGGRLLFSRSGQKGLHCSGRVPSAIAACAEGTSGGIVAFIVLVAVSRSLRCAVAFLHLSASMA